MLIVRHRANLIFINVSLYYISPGIVLHFLTYVSEALSEGEIGRVDFCVPGCMDALHFSEGGGWGWEVCANIVNISLKKLRRSIENVFKTMYEITG